jgi:transcriptional regulator with XRE-family HTH domain
MGTTATRVKTKKWRDLVNKTMSPERQARVREITEEMLAGLPLAEVRRARELSQEQIAETLRMPQGNVSKFERRVDMYVSTLRRYIQAMGGDLDIIARFPDAEIRIELFQELDELPEPRRPARTRSAAAAERAAR